MSPVLRVARTEVLEHWRQPSMLLIMVVTYVAFIAAFGIAFLAIQIVSTDPTMMALVQVQLDAAGIDFDALVYTGSAGFVTMVFWNLPLYCALIGANSVLHERTYGTMPFVMLSPLTRFQLLVGKLIGVMAIPTLLHLGFVGLSTLLLSRLAILESSGAMMGGSGSWWIAFLFSTPLMAVLITSIGTVISALSRDVRTALLYTQFLTALFGIASSALIVDMLKETAVVQVVFSVVCFFGGLAALTIGARLISRDVPPT